MTEKIVGTNEGTPNFYIDEIYPIYIVNSVENIEPTYVSWNVTVNNNISTDYYYCIDTINDEAFGHWVYESALYLVIYNKLKLIYPNIKIYIFSKRNFKISYFKAFDISIDDIVYSLPKNNIVLFNNYITLSTLDSFNMEDKYNLYLENYYNYLINKSKPITHQYDVVYFPRGKLENFKGNDRIVFNQESIIGLVESYNNSLVYYTDNTTNIIDQINIIKQAKILILDYGSSFFVNSLFCSNQNIIILGHDTLHETYLSQKIIVDHCIKRENHITFIQRIPHPLLLFHIETMKELIDNYQLSDNKSL
jgi:capsular polysaccharide biosynthesis protein